MVKRPRPCPYCGEYGTGSPGQGCCGGPSYKEPDNSEAWMVADSLNIMQQIGAIPS